MVITIIAALVMMAAYFLILYAGVGFIQDNRISGSFPLHQRRTWRPFRIKKSASPVRMWRAG